MKKKKKTKLKGPAFSKLLSSEPFALQFLNDCVNEGIFISGLKDVAKANGYIMRKNPSWKQTK